MAQFNLPLLTKLTATPGISGFEQKVREVVLKEIKGLVDDVHIDSMGNIIALKKGKKRTKIAASAHMDEIGFIVSHIDDRGFIRFHNVGGFDPKTLTSQRVTVHGKKDLPGVIGCKPVHIMREDEKGKAMLLRDYFIDLGLSKDEVTKLVSVGNPITWKGDLVDMGHCVNSKALDNRIAVYILIEALKALKGKSIPYDFYAIFSVQEEVGLRGAKIAAHQINPDFALGIDITIAFDVPGNAGFDRVTELGAGTAIKIMDGSAICDYRMVEFMKSMASKHKIKHQLEVLPAGGSDTGALQSFGKNGAITGAISIPTRNVHQVSETAHKEDINASVDLLVACVQNIAAYDWKF